MNRRKTKQMLHLLIFVWNIGLFFLKSELALEYGPQFLLFDTMTQELIILKLRSNTGNDIIDNASPVNWDVLVLESYEE